jgi:hypothetical protein
VQLSESIIANTNEEDDNHTENGDENDNEDEAQSPEQKTEQTTETTENVKLKHVSMKITVYDFIHFIRNPQKFGVKRFLNLLSFLFFFKSVHVLF